MHQQIEYNPMKKQILSLLIMLLAAGSLSAQSNSTDEVIFDRYLTQMLPQRNKPTGELMVETARFFLGVPYVAATLEKDPEQLVVNLHELDCMTLVETTTALVMTLRDSLPSFAGFQKHLQENRYRNGQITDYTDRLHYTSDWIYENEQKGRVKDITRQIGGRPHQFPLSYMSAHADSYAALKNNPERVARIAAKEKEVAARNCYGFIPEDEIAACAEGMQPGDIVGFVSSVDGLDIAHVGIVDRVNNETTFIHASSTQKKVVENDGAMADYVKGIKKNSGVVIIRPQF